MWKEGRKNTYFRWVLLKEEEENTPNAVYNAIFTQR